MGLFFNYRYGMKIYNVFESVKEKMKKAVLILIFLSSVSLFSQVKFILKSGDNSNYCENGYLKLKVIVENQGDDEILVFKVVRMLPNTEFYLMIRREPDKDFKKVFRFVCLLPTKEGYYIKIKPHSSKEFQEKIYNEEFPSEYKYRDWLLNIAYHLMDFYNLGSPNEMPLKPGKYELYCVFDDNPPEHKNVKNVLRGKYFTNKITVIIPPCKPENYKILRKKTLEKNKDDILVALVISGVLIFIFLVAIFILWLFYRLIRFVFKYFKHRKA